MNPALETTDLETLFKIALTDDSIESRRRARLNVLQQSFDLEKAHDPQFLEFLGKTIKNPSARPDCPNLATGLPRCFNPRAREGATIPKENSRRSNQCFNPRAREGATQISPR